VARIWAEVLGLDRLGVADSLFELGGDSISAFLIVARAGQELGADVPISTLLTEPTVERFAAAIQSAPRRAGTTLSAARGGDLPLTFAQERLWLAQLLAPDSPVYNRPLALRLRGALDVGALTWSLAEVLRRHDALRATFPAIDGQPVQQLLAPWTPGLDVMDLSDRPEPEREAEALRIATEEARRPFALDRGPLTRFRLIRLAPNDHVLASTFHHLVFDGWSDGVFRRDLLELYRRAVSGRREPLPELAAQCADVARWQRERAAAQAVDDLAYWSGRFGHQVPDLDLPTDRTRPPARTFAGARETFVLDAPLVAALRELGRAEGATLFATLLAAFAALLHRYGGQDDFAVGTLAHGRGRREAELLVGCFIDILPVRVDASGDPTFRAMLGRMRSAVLGAFAHQGMPFDVLVEELHPVRDPRRSPFFQALFTLRNFPDPGVAVPGLSVEPIGVETGAVTYDLVLDVDDRGSSVTCRLDYNTDLFDGATARRLAGHVERLLGAVALDSDRPLSELSFLTEAERLQLARWNETADGYPLDDVFARRFEEQVRRTPNATALVADGESVSYAELNARANRRARALVAAGVDRDGLVALLFDRSPDLVAWIVAALKAGGAFLPLDPRHPPARLGAVLGQAGPLVAIASEQYVPALQRGVAALPTEQRPRVLGTVDPASRAEDTLDLPPRSGPRDLAYVIFTSGSTGAPKGAMVEQAGMLNNLCVKIRDLGLTHADTVAQTAPQSFDISVWQTLAALLVGGRVRVVGDEARHGRCLLEVLAREKITILQVVPSLLADTLDAAKDDAEAPRLAGLRWLLSTGEPISPALCRRWLAAHPAVPILNSYGPTECSDNVTHHVITEPPPLQCARIPIGRPVSNLRVHVLDRALAPVPVGVPGELCVAGVGVGRGYVNDPARTAKAFPPDPFAADAGARLYRTGDLVRWRTDGAIEFLGRLDHQMKIRGHRIEPAEIEAALARLPDVKEAVVGPWTEDGHARLVAWVVPLDPKAPPAAGALREALCATLPRYLVPELFVSLDALPLTPNEKIDRRALPAPDMSRRPSAAGSPAAARTPLQSAIARMWAEVLGVDAIGVDDDFFELGGHSLLATRVIARIRKTLQVELPLRAFFEAPTVAALAALVEQRR
jgi:amino acid adenylation domain-containing protein